MVAGESLASGVEFRHGVALPDLHHVECSMSSDPRSFLSLKKLIARHPEAKEFYEALADTLTERNERSAVLISVSLLEGMLQKALITKLILPEKEGLNDLFGSTAPLRAFSAKIKMGFALGLYGPQTRADLDAIREVRNAFAHSMTPIDFDTPEIINVCNRIKILDAADPGDSLSCLGVRLRYVLPVICLATEFDRIANPPLAGLGFATSNNEENIYSPADFKRAMRS